MIPESLQLALLFSVLMLQFAAKRVPKHLIQIGHRLSVQNRPVGCG